MNIRLDIEREALINELQDSYQKAPIIIWGYGMCADEFLENMQGLREHVLCYVDKNESKWGTKQDGTLIISPDTFFQKYAKEDCNLIIATMYFKQVLEVLEKQGYNGNVYSAFHIVAKMKYFDYRLLEEHLDELKSIFSDDKSRELLDCIIEKRKQIEVDYSDIYEPNQYFVREIVPVDKNAVFVDAGAYHGETIDEFVEFQGGVYKKIYAFEMDKANYDELAKVHSDERICLLNYGLWDERVDMSYSSNGTSSALEVGVTGDLVARCITLDEIIGDDDVTFIKMDIEGAEYKALMGAKQTILRCKPNLAICVYHKSEDIYELTKLLHTWLPEHKCYLRHHSPRLTETVLYVIK